jgi:transcriptional regulator with XRE-family HTH domain
VSEKSKWAQELQDKATRDAFVSSQMSIPLAFQIQALREQRCLTQKQLAEKAGMLQPRIAAMEHPSGSEPNLRTLKRLASAFDVALIVRFAPFSELTEWVESFSPDTFVVPSFGNDPGFHKNEAAPVTVQSGSATTGTVIDTPDASTQPPGSVLSQVTAQHRGSQEPLEERPLEGASTSNLTSHAAFLKAREDWLAAKISLADGQGQVRQSLPQGLRSIGQRAAR